jgi:hypothetical protein
MEVENGFFLPFLKPPIAWSLSIVLIGLSIAITPRVVLASR